MSNPIITNPAFGTVSNTIPSSLNNSDWQIYVISDYNVVNDLNPNGLYEISVELALDVPAGIAIPANGDISGEYVSNLETIEVRIAEQNDQDATSSRIVSRVLTFRIDLENSNDDIKYLRFSVVSGTLERKKKVVSTDPNNHPFIG